MVGSWMVWVGWVKVFLVVPQILKQIVKVVALSVLQVAERTQEQQGATVQKTVEIPAVDVPVLFCDKFQQSKVYVLNVPQILSRRRDRYPQCLLHGPGAVLGGC